MRQTVIIVALWFKKCSLIISADYLISALGGRVTEKQNQPNKPTNKKETKLGSVEYLNKH